MPKNTKYITTSGNMAASKMAYAMSEIAAIYPITPSSDMAEHYDVLSNKGVKNIFGKTPVVSELQSEAGAAGALHGALAGGALATTFTASQGLLLMIPNMFKIAGELLPCTMHVSARTVATHALSIFGDHSDVMAVRSTGWAMLASSNVQEAQDMALVAHLASIKSSYPFLHFFDGFRTSHEVNKIESIEYPMIKTMVKELEIEKDVKKFYGRALDPRTPHQAGTAQNPDTYFQNREACNDILGSIPNIIHNILTSFDKHTGRKYSAFEYFGNQNAKHVTVCMASATDTIREYLDSAKNGNGHNGGLVKVRLYRPFDVRAFLSTLPKSVETITVLDRTKENGSVGEPLFVDVCAALLEGGRGNIKVIRGRYGLASKEFTVPMVHAVYENMCSKEPKNGFTIGINDDVSHTSLEYEGFKNTFTNNKDVVECKFFGLGSDGTVSANKNTATIINDETDKFAQVYFVYDSKKSGATTVSHMRFADKPINMPYLVTEPSFIACHNQSFLGKFDMLSGIKNGGTFLLNTTYSPSEIDTLLPDNIKRTIRDKSINLYIINAYKIATDVGLGKRINTIMQSAFFYLAKIIDYKSAVEFMRLAAKKSYSAKGEKVLAMNYSAIDSVVKNLHMIDHNMLGSLSNTQPNIGSKCKYYDEFSHVINSRKGDTLPVSAFSPDGFVPTGTSQYEKRNLATMLPEWVPENCIQCNFCALVCPHATIRPHLLDGKEKMPKNFKTIKANGFADKQYRIQLNPHDCTGCGQCANICPAKNKALVMKDFVAVDESENYYASLKLPYPKSDDLPMSVKNSQFLKPYFEFSGACAGCGQTPYIKLVSQLFGDRMVIANATGCTSIYGGSSPTCPYTVDKKGHGPAWANSLFEDNAEFGYGVKLAKEIRGKDTSVWIIGGDGWAYDIGFGGVDHIAAQNLDVNILVLDTEVYSNTGGQSSKSTPAGSVAKFAAAGKSTNKKDLGAMLMNYDNVYVAQIAIGADYNQTLNAIREAEAHKGPSVIIAYSTCINHGIDMSNGMRVMRNAVECGYWVNYRRRPATDGKPAEFILDSKAPTGSYSDFIANETRYKSLMKCNPEAAAKLCEQAETAAKQRYEKYKKLTNAPLT